MKINARTWLITIFFTTFSSILSGQEVCPSADIPFEFDHSEFNGKFCVYVASEESSDYYVIDLEKLPLRFDRIYFLNLVYKEKKVISIDNDINKDVLWFKSFDTFSREDVICLMEELLLETGAAIDSYSENQKSEWLQVHDKFSKK